MFHEMRKIRSQSQSKIWLAMLCLGLSTQAFTQNLSPPLVDSEEPLKWGVSVAVNYASNVYSINDLNTNQLSDPQLKTNKLFSSGIGRFGTHLQHKNCLLGIEKTYMGAATSNKDALNIYNSINSQGFSPTINSTYAPSVSYTALEGEGIGFGCTILSNYGLKLGGSLHAIKLESFTQRSYAGSVVASQNSTLVLLNERWLSMNSQISELQNDESTGKAYTVDVDVGYRQSDVPVFGNLLINNFSNAVQFNSMPYLYRNLNATFKQGGVFQNGHIPPLSGRYGNDSQALKIPRVWSANAGYQVSESVDIGLRLNGVDLNYQTMAQATLRCTGCQTGTGFDVLVDTNLSNFGIGYTTANWSVYWGSFLHGLGTNSTNFLNLNYRY